MSLRLDYPHQSPIGFKQLFGIKGLSIFDNSERSLGQFVAERFNGHHPIGFCRFARVKALGVGSISNAKIGRFHIGPV